MLNAEDNCFESIEKDSAVQGVCERSYDKPRSSLSHMLVIGKTQGIQAKRHRTKLDKDRLEAFRDK